MTAASDDISVIKKTFATHQKTLIAQWPWKERPVLSIPAETGEPAAPPAPGEDAAPVAGGVEFEAIYNRLVGRLNGTEYTVAFFGPSA